MKLKRLACFALVGLLFALPLSANAENINDSLSTGIPSNIQDIEAYSVATAGMTQSAALLQGDTDDSGDVDVFTSQLNAKGYSITPYGFRGTRGSSSGNATGSNLSSAVSNSMFVYWSGHGSNIPKLNVINGPSFNTLSYFNPTTSSSLRIAIFGACKQLDGDSNRSSFAQVMRNSKLRVLAAYHEKAPDGPTKDTACANGFFTSVKAGNSIRYAWEYANALSTVGKSGAWIVLAYQNGEMEYYRMPGYPNERNTEYTLPTSSTPIYRYWGLANPAVSLSASSPSIDTLATETEIPLILKPVGNRGMITENSVMRMMPNAAIVDNGKGQSYLVREPSTAPMANSNAKSSVNMFMQDSLSLNDAMSNARLDEYLVMSAEIKNDGSDGPESIIGRRYTYTNTYNGIPVEGNGLSIGFDKDGVYDIIDMWVDLVPADDAMITGDTMMKKATDFNIRSAIQSGTLAYVENNNGDYVLSVLIDNADETQSYISLVDGKEVK